MLSTRDIKRKIRTVQNIQQICRAMKTVSSIKLRKAEERIVAARPYATAMREMVASWGHVNIRTRCWKCARCGTPRVVAISADKGLAGSYNTNDHSRGCRLVLQLNASARACLSGERSPILSPCRDSRSKLPSLLSAPRPEFRTIAALADHIGEQYTTRRVGPRRLDLYRIRRASDDTCNCCPFNRRSGRKRSPISSTNPMPAPFWSSLLPRYLRTVLYTAVLSAVAAEHAARVAAMSLATENADELIGKLTLEYNKSRQADHHQRTDRPGRRRRGVVVIRSSRLKVQSLVVAESYGRWIIGPCRSKVQSYDRVKIMNFESNLNVNA